MIPIVDTVPTERRPWMTVGLTFANVVLYVVITVGGGSLITGPDHRELSRHGFVPGAISGGCAGGCGGGAHAWWAALSAMALHGSVVHLLAELVFLIVAGRTLEDATGPLRVLALYLAGGAVAAAVRLALAPHSGVASVGGAGSIGALLGAWITIYPRTRVLTFCVVPRYMSLFELPAAAILALWFAVQAAFAATHVSDAFGGTSVAWAAFLGGATATALGAVLVPLLRARRRPSLPARPRRPLTAPSPGT